MTTAPTSSGKFETRPNGFGGRTTVRTAPRVIDVKRKRERPRTLSVPTPATDAQKRYLRVLIAQCADTEALASIRKQLNEAVSSNTFTKELASEAISALKTLKSNKA